MPKSAKSIEIIQSKSAASASPKQDLHEERYFSDIHISVDALENVHGKYPCTEIIVQTEFLGTVIGESAQQPLTDDYSCPHRFHCVLRYYANNPQCINDLVNNPVVFNVFQVEGILDDEYISKKIVEDPEEKIADTFLDNNQKKKESKTTKPSPIKKGGSNAKLSGKEAKKGTAQLPEPVGRCNVDLLPLLMGATYIKENLPLEQDYIIMDETMVTYTNLPHIKVHIYVDEPIMSKDDIDLGNVFQISVESIYNMAPEPFMRKVMYYTFGTPLPINRDTDEPILIYDGIVTEKPDLEQTKIWSNLAGLQNRVCYTKYEFDKDYLSINNPLPIDLKETFENHKIEFNIDDPLVVLRERVEWNIMHRVWMPPMSREMFIQRLRKYRLWPIEIFGTKTPLRRENFVLDPSADIPQVTPRQKDELPFVDPKLDIHLMGYLDLTKLLYTGVSKTRVLTQLFTFDAVKLKEETGMLEPIFKESIVLPTDRKSPVRNKSAKVVPSSMIDESVTYVPLQTENEEPTFIVVEIELLKPLYKKRTLENLVKDLRNLIPERPTIPRPILQVQMVEKEFEQCTEEIVHILYCEYKKFLDRNVENKTHVSDEKSRTHVSNDDEESNFNQFLIDSGVYADIKKTLKKKIYKLVNEKFSFQGDADVIQVLDDYINKIYVYIIKKINTVINSFLGPNVVLTETQEEQCYLNSTRNLLLYAKEAEENDDIKTAERYYLERISLNEQNPTYWLDYAVFALNQNRIDDAYKYCEECLQLDFDNKYGLILLASLLKQKNNFISAERCLLKLVENHPKFLPGIVILHLYYLSIRKYEGSDVMYETAIKYLEKNVDTELDSFETSKEISWEVSFWKPKQMYARTTVLLLKLRCFELAEIALAQDLISNPESQCYSYYYAVKLYLNKQYSAAIESLQDALRLHGPDITVGGLLGHCYYKLQYNNSAIETYEALLYTYDRADDILLIYSRLASLYKQACKHKEALKIILLACKYIPTPNTWLQAGIIQNYLEALEDAEICLSESNLLDNKRCETWQNLAEVNTKMNNIFVAKICRQFVDECKCTEEKFAGKISVDTALENKK